MTMHTTRAILLSKLLRSGDRARIARLMDRLDPQDVSRLFAGLSELELRRAACVLFHDDRIDRTFAELPSPVVGRLILAAPSAEARLALARLSPAEIARLVVGLGETRRLALLDLLPADVRGRVEQMLPRGPRRVPSAVFRLRRLFA